LASPALEAAKISAAAALLVTTNLDDATALVVLSARQLNAGETVSTCKRVVDFMTLLWFDIDPLMIGFK
jgi:voltage-gated potassium channel Kch